MKKRLMKRLLVCLFGALLLVSSACIKTDDVTETASSGTAPGSTVTAEVFALYIPAPVTDPGIFSLITCFQKISIHLHRFPYYGPHTA